MGDKKSSLIEIRDFFTKLLLYKYMLTITNQSDYGFLFLSYLLGKKDYVPHSEVVEQTKLPKRFLARISATLVKHGILESKEGKLGGYKLARDLRSLSLYDYLKIFEKDVAVAKCVDRDFNCPYDAVCVHKSFLRHRLNNIVLHRLKKTKLSELFES